MFANWHEIAFIAHRGYHNQIPENTIPAFERAAQLGFRAIECDAQTTQDGVVVIFHDDTLVRTTGQPGFLKDLTAAQLAELNAAHHMSDYPMTSVPTLVEMLACVTAHGLALNLEIKQDASSAYNAFNTDHVIAALRESSALRDGLPCVVSSFDVPSLHRFHRAMPDIPLALLIDWEDAQSRAYFTLDCLHELNQALQLSAIHMNDLSPWEGDVLGAEDIAQIQAVNQVLRIYTVNDAARAAWLLAAGCQSVFTDVILPDERIAE